MVNEKMISSKEYIQEFAQTYSAKGTSRKQIAHTFKLVTFEPNTVNLDIGGGAYDLATDHLKQLGVTNIVVDKFNRTPEHNKSGLDFIISNGGADTVTVNNVLNVVDNLQERINVINMAKQYLKSGGVAYFLIYEGNKSGVGRVTKACGNDSNWQNNLRAIEYIPKIQSVFPTVSKRSNLIIAKK